MAEEETRHDPQPVAPAAGELPPGTLLNGIYRIEERLGVGGMGEVYRATNIANDEQDAIKIIGRGRADQTLIEAMFRKEARVLSRIRSPAVAQLKLFARDTDLGLLYFVTDFVPGESLLDRLKRQPGSPDELRALLRRLLHGLEAVHEAGAVHRDLSPDNVILPDGDPAEAKIIDFGIAKELDPTHTTMVGDSFAGKLGYIAPEQLGFSGAEVGPWTDLYSLALVGAAFAAGKPLDMGATVGRAEEARRGPIDLTALPDDLRPMFARLLTYDWRERPQSAAEVLAMLDDEAAPGRLTSFAERTDHVAGPAPTAATGAPAATPVGRQAWPLVVGVLAVVLLVVAGVLATRRPAPDQTATAAPAQPRPSASQGDRDEPVAAASTAPAAAPASSPPQAGDRLFHPRTISVGCGPAIHIAYGPSRGAFPDGAQMLIHGAMDIANMCNPTAIIVTGKAQTGEDQAADLARRRAEGTVAALRGAGVPASMISTKLHVATPDRSKPMGQFQYLETQIDLVK